MTQHAQQWQLHLLPSPVAQAAPHNPGEPLNLTRLRTRAPRPATIPTVKKARVQATPVDATLLLDQAHARRLALIAAEENRAAHGTSNASAVVWQ